MVEVDQGIHGVRRRRKVPRSGASPPSVPLSKAHISPRDRKYRENKGKKYIGDGSYWIVNQGSNVLFLRESPTEWRLRKAGLLKKADDVNSAWRGGRRKEISEFSRGSRRRLLRRMGGVDWDHVMHRMAAVVFVTLTYPAEYPTARASKRDLDVFLKRFVREYPEAFGFWKLEPQRRGAPHYHLLLAVGEYSCFDHTNDLIMSMREWVPRAWCEVVASDDPMHYWFHDNRKVKVVEEVRSKNGVMRYAGKYVGKAQEGSVASERGDWPHSGRWWGLINGGALREFVRGFGLEVNREAWVMIRRLFRRVSPDRVRRSQTARGVGSWFTYDRDGCKNAFGGSFLNQAVAWALPGRQAFRHHLDCVDIFAYCFT